jgi:uncharacterized repeat protein (TIGR03843 family)
MNPTSFLTWAPEAIKHGKLQLQGQFAHSSNYTFLVRVEDGERRFDAVYKPLRGERPLWDFPRGTLAKREVAAYIVSQALGWELVPPTIFRRDAPLGPGSLQLFIEHNPEYHFFSFKESDKQRLRPVVLFDLLVNNADRKGSHVLLDAEDHLWLIDHGICFHEEDKLRTVIWDFAGEEMSPSLLDDLSRFSGQLENEEKVYKQLLKMLSTAEIRALLSRAHSLLMIQTFPYPSEIRRPYPWPPV